MTGLAAAFAAAEIKNGPECGVKAMLERLDTADAEALREALASKIAGTKIAEILTAAGHEITERPIQRHRRGKCKCQR